MKHTLSLLTLSTALLLWSCGGGDNNESSTITDTAGTTVSTSATDTFASRDAGTAGTMATTSSTPLEKKDKDFVLKAAGGGIMEVELGNIAQQNASSQRVKDFGSMMVRDHSKANDELKSLASAKGTMLNADSLMNVHKSHIESLRKKTGAEFDKAYMKMMVTDHQKDVSEFKKSSTGAKDADLKTWAESKLPTLQMHLDSAQAINKSLTAK